MDNLQSSVETTLLGADYVSTTDVLVLQALVLYLASFGRRFTRTFADTILACHA